MPFTLAPLPYDASAFGETISKRTFDFHHGKHHKAYVDKTNAALGDKGLEGARLSDVIRAARDTGDKGLFNNSGQTWNHNFYWQCLSPERQSPDGALKAKLEEAFGSVESFLDQFKAEAVGHFASGWAWLVLDQGALKITSLHDADCPVAHDGMKPLLTLDVWEHAYYLDYQNERPRHIDTLLSTAINWEFVARNLDGEGVSRADQDSGVGASTQRAEPAL